MNIIHVNKTILGESIAIIPILRAGLGMTDALLELMPYSTVHHIGKQEKNIMCTL